MRSATIDEQIVASCVAEGVVDRLEVVEVEQEDDGVRTARVVAAKRVGRGLDERGPVRQIGERVVVRLVAELLLEMRQLRERLLELAVLERDRGLVRDRLEQQQVVAPEHRSLGEPVGDGDDADDPRLAGAAARSSPGGSA